MISKKFKAVDEDGNTLGEVWATSETSAKMRFEAELGAESTPGLKDLPNTWEDWEAADFQVEEK